MDIKQDQSQEEATSSKYFQKYSKICDLDIDFTEFDNDLQDFELETHVMEYNEQMEPNQIATNEQIADQMAVTIADEDNLLDIKKEPEEDVFDDELDKLLEKDETLSEMLECNEDFQDFGESSKPKTNDSESINNNNNSQKCVSVFHGHEWPVKYWRHHLPAFEPNQQTFYDPRPK